MRLIPSSLFHTTHQHTSHPFVSDKIFQTYLDFELSPFMCLVNLLNGSKLSQNSSLTYTFILHLFNPPSITGYQNPSILLNFPNAQKSVIPKNKSLSPPTSLTCCHLIITSKDNSCLFTLVRDNCVWSLYYPFFSTADLCFCHPVKLI